MGEKGSQRVFWRPTFQLSPMLAMDIFRLAVKERTRMVQLHVGLHKGSPGDFSCTQSVPLGAHLDGGKGLGKCFLRLEFSIVDDAG